MPSIPDHPIRLYRARAGITQTELATSAGVTRAAIAAIEEGRVKNPRHSIIQQLSLYTGISEEMIQKELAAWQTSPPTLSRRAQNTLALPEHIVRQYESFAQWRTDIAPTITAFASLTHVPRASVARYEKGELAVMPTPLVAGIQYLGASDKYITELMSVPNGYTQET